MRAGCHRLATLHRLSPSQSMQVSAVNVSLTAGESARIAISTSWSTAKEMSCESVRYGPATCARLRLFPMCVAASDGHTVASGCPSTTK